MSRKFTFISNTIFTTSFNLLFNVLLLQKQFKPLKSAPDHVYLALVVLKATTLLFADAGRMSVEQQESRRFRLVLAVNSWEPSSTRLVMLLAFGTSRADKIAITIFGYSRKISRLMQLTSSVSILRYICDFHSKSSKIRNIPKYFSHNMEAVVRAPDFVTKNPWVRSDH